MRGLTRTVVELDIVWMGAGYTLRDRLQVIPCWLTVGHRLRKKPPLEEVMAHIY